MATSSTRFISVAFTGDAPGSMSVAAATNATSPGESIPVALSSGNNTIAIPSGGTSPSALTILKPVGNAVAITLKGANADVGVPLHPTDPDSISLGAGAALVLNAASAVNIRLVWS